MHRQGDIAFRFRTPEQRVKAVNFNACKMLPKLIGYHSNVPLATAKLMCQFYNPHIYVYQS